MILYLLRHGDAVDSGFDDSSRPLSPLGEEQAASVANVFSMFHLPLDAVLSSPLVRAKQMAEIISAAFKNVKCTATEYLVPGTNEKQLFRQLNELKKQSVLLVGHEPHVRTTASMLLWGSRHGQIEFRKATILCIECVHAVQPESGMLKWMLTADHMSMLRGR